MAVSGVPESVEKILQALQNRDVNFFRKALAEIDIKNEAENSGLYICLIVACLELGTREFIQELLKTGVDQNKLHGPRKLAAIHYAANAHNVEALKVLLEDSNTLVNRLDLFGNTVLHILANDGEIGNEDRMLCLKELLNRKDLHVNHSNRQSCTAIHYAASRKDKQMVEYILKNRNIDLDSAETFDGITARKTIMDNLQELENILPRIAAKDDANDHDCDDDDDDDDVGKVFSIMDQNDIENFRKYLDRMCERNPKFVDSSDGLYTILQKACDSGLTDFVKELVENKADLNKTGEIYIELPSFIAASGGYYDILEYLIDKGAKCFCKEHGTLLHKVIKASKWKRDNDKLKKCFKLLIKNSDKIPINSIDKDGNTPLHIADKNNDQYFITELITHGASIAIKNRAGELPLKNITSNTLEQVLNHQLKLVNCRDKDRSPNTDRGIIFDYTFLSAPSPPNSNSSKETIRLTLSKEPETQLSETDALVYFSKRPDLRIVLKHPTITAFLGFKWCGVKPLFFINMGFYFAFVTILTTYITCVYQYIPSNSSNDRSMNESDKEECKYTNDIPDMVEPSTGVLPTGVVRYVWFSLLILWICIFLRELFQMAMQPIKYFSYLENYIEVSIIVTTSIIIFHENGWEKMRPQLSAITIVLSCSEIFLLTGRHPRIATNIEMLKNVARNSILFLVWYSIIIIGFIISFHILFKRNECGKNLNFFRTPSAIFKTLVMITGEFELGDIPFMVFPVTSHLIFLLFIFTVAIVLLNALAIAGTQGIRGDAELAATISRVKFVSYTEGMLYGKPFWKNQNSRCHLFLQRCNLIPSVFLTKLVQRVALLPKLLPHNKLFIRESDLQIFKVPSILENNSQLTDTSMPIININFHLFQNALNIIENNEQVKERLEQAEVHFEKLKTELTTEIQILRKELSTDIGKLQNEFTSQISILKTELIDIVTSSRK